VCFPAFGTESPSFSPWESESGVNPELQSHFSYLDSIPADKRLDISPHPDLMRNFIVYLPEICSFLDEQLKTGQSQVDGMKGVAAQKDENVKQTILLFQCEEDVHPGIFAVVGYLMQKKPYASEPGMGLSLHQGRMDTKGPQSLGRQATTSGKIPPRLAFQTWCPTCGMGRGTMPALGE
jgi:hypothetical protein